MDLFVQTKRVFETCMRQEQLDGHRMTQLALQQGGAQELASLAMQYAGDVDERLITEMARFLLSRWMQSVSPEAP